MTEETKTVLPEDRGHEESHGRWEDHAHKRHVHHHGQPYALGPIWAIGWLFTIGYLHLPFFWKGVLAVVVWPYYLGSFLAGHP